jgi:hypothetical protein
VAYGLGGAPKLDGGMVVVGNAFVGYASDRAIVLVGVAGPRPEVVEGGSDVG